MHHFDDMRSWNTAVRSTGKVYPFDTATILVELDIVGDIPIRITLYDIPIGWSIVNRDIALGDIRSILQRLT